MATLGIAWLLAVLGQFEAVGPIGATDHWASLCLLGAGVTLDQLCFAPGCPRTRACEGTPVSGLGGMGHQPYQDLGINEAGEEVLVGKRLQGAPPSLNPFPPPPQLLFPLPPSVYPGTGWVHCLETGHRRSDCGLSLLTGTFETCFSNGWHKVLTERGVGALCGGFSGLEFPLEIRARERPM